MNTSPLMSRLEEGKRQLLSKCGEFPKFVVVLGSGLGGLLDDLDKEVEIPLADLAHIRPTTTEGHRGRLVIGKLGGVRVACMQGRLHFFEGYSMEEVVYPARLFAWAGAEVFFLTNATGGLRPDLAPLDLVLVKDHINLMGTNPLIGPNYDQLGPRFPDLSQLYDPKLSSLISTTAKKLNIPLKEGVYVAIHGPSYETPAEIKMYRLLGGDIVGMSTVPEAISLHHMKKRVASISLVTNLAAGVTNENLVHSDVLEVGKKSYKTFSKLISEVIRIAGAEYE